MKACPVCLNEPLVSSTNNTRWYCYCKITEHNERLAPKQDLDMHFESSKEQSINFWDSIVESYQKANPTLKNEAPLVCALCGIVPTLRQRDDKTIWPTTTGLWDCYCLDEEKHTENKKGICACGHRDHHDKDCLFGAYAEESKAKAVRVWNERVLKYNKLHEKKDA